MPILGIFSRRDKRDKQNLHPSSSTASGRSSATSDSPEGDYVLPSSSLPIRPNGHNIYASPNTPSSSSSILKLPFRRKHLQPRDANLNTSIISLNDQRPPKTSWMSSASVISDAPLDLLSSPPSRPMAIGERNGQLSTRSLPVHSPSKPLDSPPPTPPPKKSTSSGFFGWASRERTKSKPSPPLQLQLPPNESFNLKSFRHISSESPSIPIMLDPPPPRPRGSSIASNDSSQRISVAAFREAQARRSAANSPVPSFRPPSTADTLAIPIQQSPRTSVSSSQVKQLPPRRSTAPALSSKSTSSESESEDSESDSDDMAKSDSGRLGRKRTITQRSQAKSDMGHAPNRPSFFSASTTTYQVSTKVEDGKQAPPKPAPRASTSMGLYTRQRASVSTSALTPNAAARRASVVAAANANASKAPKARSPNSDTSDSSSESDEDVPLSTLVNPRPASAMSAHSRGRAPVPRKPLVDIRAVIEGRDQSAFVQPDKAASAAGKGKGKEMPDSPGQWTETSRPAKGHRRTSSDVVMSASFMLDNDNDTSLAPSSGIRVVASSSPRNDSQPSLQDMDEVPVLDDRHIVPTPIRQRDPPSSFSVTSRPRPQTTQSSGSASTEPSPVSSRPRSSMAVSQASSPSSSPSKMSPSFPSARPRSSTLTHTLDNTPPSLPPGRSTAPPMARLRSTTLASSSPSSHDVPRLPPVPLISAKRNADSPSPSSSPRTRPSAPASPGHRREGSGTSAAPSQGTFTSGTKPRGSTLISMIPSSPTASPPVKPWSARRESPASSTGDSSSGRLPLTPKDGSEFGFGRRDYTESTRWGSELGARQSTVGATSVVSGKKPGKKAGVTFDVEKETRGRERIVTRDRVERESIDEDEVRRRERRRGEAKNAIELGNVVNGRPPVLDEEDIMSANLNPRFTMMNPMNGVPAQPWTSMAPTSPQIMPMTPPQFMSDPNFFAAHQQAMMIAKQTYQYAVAQQALAAAGDEWERGSNVSAFSGAPSGGYFAQGGFGMGMPMNGGAWSPGPVMFPSAARSVYAGSVLGGAQSEVGWGSRSVYGEAFGPSSGDRPSMGFRNQGQSARVSFGQRNGSGDLSAGPTKQTLRPRTTTAPSNALLPSQHARAGKRPPPPPSSWKPQS